MLCSFDFTIIMISDKIGLTVSEYTCHQSIWQPWVGYSAILRDDRTWAPLPYSSTYHSGLRKFSFFILCPYKCFLWVFCISSPPLFFSVHSVSSFDLFYRKPFRNLHSIHVFMSCLCCRPLSANCTCCTLIPSVFPVHPILLNAFIKFFRSTLSKAYS